MNLQKILQSIQSRYTSLPDDCIEALLTNLTIHTHPKNEILVKEGQYSKKVFFLIEGTARAYYYKNEKDISDWFAFEEEFISPIVSFFSDKPSAHYIQVLENSIVGEISHETVEQLSKKYHAFEKLMRIVVTETMLRQQRRISSILFHSAQEKYAQLLVEYPNILEKIPLTHIASHLGMTLETLSRVRRPKA